MAGEDATHITVASMVNGLGILIAHDLREREMLRNYPDGHADRTDDRIKFHQNRATALRKLREDLENYMAEVPPSGM